MKKIISLFAVLMAGLVTGAVFGIWLSKNPVDLPARIYIEQQQINIRALNTIMPILGLIAILLNLVAAAFERRNRLTLRLFMLAAAFFIVSGLVTRFGNQTINSIVMTWDPANPPDNWEELRDRWWLWHQVRTLSSVLAFALSIAAIISTRRNADEREFKRAPGS